MQTKKRKQASPKHRRKRYAEYDYESEYTHDCDITEEEAKRIINEQRKALYATKTIKAGTQMQVEVYPEFTRLPSGIARKEPRSTMAQRNLNDANSRKECEMVINTNFTEDDNWYTLTFGSYTLPSSMDEARKHAKNWIKSVNRKRKAKGLPSAKYVYVIEWSDKSKGKQKVRCHIHCVMDGALSMEETLALWKQGMRNHSRRLAFDENGLSGLAKYIAKDSLIGEKKWCASLGLKRPKENKNHQTFRRRRVEKIAQRPATMQREMEAKYPAYWFVQGAAKWNKVNGLFYLSARMRVKALEGDIVRVAGDYEAVEKLPYQTRRALAVQRLRVVETNYDIPGKETVTVLAATNKTFVLPARAVLVVRRE